MSDDLVEKCPRPGSRIKDLDTVDLLILCFTISFFIMSLKEYLMFDLAGISESPTESKMGLEHIIDGSHDESDYRSRRIEYSSFHTQ